MGLFFEEENAKKLIRVQQILMLLSIGLIELMESEIFKKSTSISAIKNILANIHKNYLIFIEFICKNLTEHQKQKTKEWVTELFRILQDRPAAKTYYKSNNTQKLIMNNELSLNLLKHL